MKENGQLPKSATLIPGGLIVVILVILPILINSGKSSLPDFVALLAFAIALPILAVEIMLRYASLDYPDTEDAGSRRRRYMGLLNILIKISYIITGIGLGATLWNISWIIGVAFLISGIIILTIFMFWAVG